MKKFIFLFMALGAMVSATSCSTAYRGGYYDDAIYFNGQTSRQFLPQYDDNDVIYHRGNLTADGTIVIGNRANPRELRWSNMSMVFNGLLIYCYDQQNRLIASYDLRVPGQSVNDTFSVIGVTGKALSVNLVIRGGAGSINFLVVTDGYNKKHYSLTY